MADASTQKNNFTVEFGNSQYGIIKLFLVINEKPYSIGAEKPPILSNDSGTNRKFSYLDWNSEANCQNFN